MSAAPVIDVDHNRLFEWLEQAVEGFACPMSIDKFAGGQSNPTYRVDAASGTYVLRRKPYGTLLPTAHAVEREYRLLAALHPTGFPVPRPLALCEDESVFGSVFYVMEMVDGRSFWDGALPGVDPRVRTGLYENMLETLARLHSIEPGAVGLGDFGRAGNFFERQIARWTKQYRASQTDDLASVERLIEWLPQTLPQQSATTIVHGDFRIDNMIFAAGDPRVVAVLDWELSTLGDPLADFSYFLMAWVTEPEGRMGIMGLAGAQSGIPTMEAVVERYCEATGRAGVPNLDWYFAYNLFRLTGIVQGVKKRLIDGNASSARAARTAARLPALADAAWVFAQKAGAR